MSKTPLRVLCIEDTMIDAELLEAHLGLNEFDVFLKRVETAEELKTALAAEPWDIALADYNLPHFNAVMALKIIKESGHDIPVIIVSGTIGENRAIEMMRAGANDFVVKGDFLRLIPAIRRELGEASNRKARHQAEAALAVSEASFRQLADAMPQLVWTAAPDGQITYANQRCYSYTGLGEEQLLGWAWKSLVRPFESLIKYEQNIVLGTDLSIEHQLRGADGQYRWFLTRATPTRDSTGKITSWYATSTDIHEQKTVAEELQLAKSLAEQANQAKSAFLANMSHEIRTPLGAILGFAELMEDPTQTETERRECISTIRRNGELLSKVINEILDLSKIESQKMEIDNISFNLSEALDDIRSLLDLNAKGKGLSLEFRSEGPIPKTIISDPTRLRQILINIVGNAVKFTDAGKILLTTRLQQRDPGTSNAILEFEVTDTGVGISKEQAAKLFQPFVQADNSMTRKYGGTGLGLNLSRKLAQALGGDVILAKSKLGEGSTFICRIQVKLTSNESLHFSHDNEAFTSNAISIEAPLKGKKVLVIDDLPENRLLIDRYLSRAGAIVEAEDNGLKGVERAMSSTYDVVLLDIHMPIMDGFEALANLKAKGFNKPVIALTAYAMRGDRERCLKAGFTEHLSKPIDRGQLIELIRSLSLGND